MILMSEITVVKISPQQVLGVCRRGTYREIPVMPHRSSAKNLVGNMTSGDGPSDL